MAFFPTDSFSQVNCARLRGGNRLNGNNILDSSADPLCLFVIPGSCDFVVWFSLIHLQSKPRRNTNTKPIHTKAASRMSQVYYCRLNGFRFSDTHDHPAEGVCRKKELCAFLRSRRLCDELFLHENSTQRRRGR